MSQPHNFCFPIRTLSNDRVKLVPLSVEKHASSLVNQLIAHPELYAHMPLGPYTSTSDFVSSYLEKTSFPNPGYFTFAVIDLTRPASPEDSEGELAGMMSFMDTSTVHLSTEIGFVVVLPQYQRTHVTTNAVGLMLQYALDGPDRGGIGLRRVQWKTSSMNPASARAAERLGFRHEGVLRWHMVFRGGEEKGKVGNGRGLPPGGEKGDLGRDTVMMGLCWDDWEGGARKKVEGLMARRE
ncbi:putative acetyltransferase [Triangularia verruculosa]|uniref:Acetyltransferase n=1 Tax=Triangularia verruculosa TaxID=2587418 RepID=A0AAN6XKS5_9PEZI|nr:putative acetyltransferase [Triangularia verruculosa]